MLFREGDGLTTIATEKNQNKCQRIETAVANKKDLSVNDQLRYSLDEEPMLQISLFFVRRDVDLRNTGFAAHIPYFHDTAQRSVGVRP